MSAALSLAIGSLLLGQLRAGCTSCGSYGHCAEWANDTATATTIATTASTTASTATTNGTCTTCLCPSEISAACCADPTPCEPSPCSANETCIPNGATSYECYCPTGFTGDNCTDKVTTCEGHTTLASVCSSTVTHELADTTTTSLLNMSTTAMHTTTSSAETGGTCAPTTEASVCSECTSGLLTCRNNGNCSVVNDTATCVCENGYDGDHCEVELGCASKPCKNGGKCSNVNGTGWRCDCLSLYNGTDCGEYMPCNGQPCQHGQCVALGGGQFECNCTFGYNGTLCETEIDYCTPGLCKYNGTCTSYVGYFMCACRSGSYGTTCEYLNDNCQTYNSTDGERTVCNSNDTDATCTNGFNTYNCSCSSEWAGKNCTLPIVVWNALKYFEDPTVNVTNFLLSIYTDPEAIVLASTYVVATINLNNLSEAGWSLHEMIEWATFEQRDINISDNFFMFSDASLGNCFTFNRPENKYTFNLRNSGEQNGLAIMTKVNEAEYLPWVDMAMNTVFVESYNTLVFAESLSFNAIPGAVSVLRVEKSTYTRLGGHYGRCASKGKDVSAYYYFGNYTTDACLWGCYQDRVNDICGCMDPRYLKASWATYCGLDDMLCVYRITQNYGEPASWSHCDCPNECISIEYSAQWDTAEFPAFPGECIPYEDNQTAWNACVNRYNDYAKVIVYFPDITQTTYAETAKWNFNSILAYFGGLVGAVMGFSFVSVIEIAFLVYRCLLVTCTNESATLDEVEVGNGEDDEGRDLTASVLLEGVPGADGTRAGPAGAHEQHGVPGGAAVASDQPGQVQAEAADAPVQPVQPRLESQPVQPRQEGMPVQPRQEGMPVQPRQEGMPVQPSQPPSPESGPVPAKQEGQPGEENQPVKPIKESQPVQSEPDKQPAKSPPTSTNDKPRSRERARSTAAAPAADPVPPAPVHAAPVQAPPGLPETNEPETKTPAK